MPWGFSYSGSIDSQGALHLMFAHTNNSSYTTTAIRNYTIAALSVLTLSMGVSELFNSPARVATQNTIDNYSSYIGAGLVSYAQSSLR